MLRIKSGEMMSSRILPDAYWDDVAYQLTVEDDFSFLCKLDYLAGILPLEHNEFPAIADSCYISLEEVFC